MQLPVLKKKPLLNTVRDYTIGLTDSIVICTRITRLKIIIIEI